MKNAFVLVALSLLLISCTANDFLSSTVDRLDGIPIDDMSVGDFWSGLGYTTAGSVRVATVTVNRSTSQSYIDYPIEIVSNFNTPNSAPIWVGMLYAGEISFKPMTTIKVITQDDNNIWNEVPSQLSYRTQCYKAGTYELVTCSTANYRVAVMDLYFLDNLTTSGKIYKVLYVKDFYNNVPFYTRFVYNETSTNYNAVSTPYPARVNYKTSSKQIQIPEIPTNYTLSSTGQITSVKYGAIADIYNICLPGYVAPNCLEGTYKLFGLTIPSYDISAPSMIEYSSPVCNLGGLGTGSGYFDIMISPYWSISDISSNIYSASQIKFMSVGGLSTYGAIVDHGQSDAYPGYYNTSGIFVSFPYQSTEYTGNSSIYYGFGGAEIKWDNHVRWYSINMPVMYAVLNTTSTAFGKVSASKGNIYAVAGLQTLNSNTYATGLDINDRLTVVYAPITYSSSFCGVIKGSSSKSIFNSIVSSEYFGGKIRRNIGEGSYRVPCTDTGENYCQDAYLIPIDTEGNYVVSGTDMDTYSCNSLFTSEYLGYTDMCGDFHACLSCDPCTENADSFTCNTGCVGSPVEYVCYDNNRYMNTTCGMVLDTECGTGLCNNGKCVDGVDVQAYISDYSSTAALPGVTVTLQHQSISTYNSTGTTDINGILKVNLPKGIYTMTASKDGYTSQSKTVGIDSSYSRGCANIRNGQAYPPCSMQLRTGTDLNASTVCITTKNDLNEAVLGANVDLNINSISYTGITQIDGVFYYNSTPCAVVNPSNGTANLTIQLDGYITETDSFYVTAGTDYNLVYTLTPVGNINITGNIEGSTGRFLNGKAIVTLNSPITGTLKVIRQDVVAYRCADIACQTYKSMSFLQPICVEGDCPQDLAAKFAANMSSYTGTKSESNTESIGDSSNVARTIYSTLKSVCDYAKNLDPAISNQCAVIYLGDALLNLGTSGEVPRSLFIGMNQVPYQVNIAGLGTATAYAIKNFADNSTAMCSLYGQKNKLFVPNGFTRFTTDYLMFAVDADQYLADYSDKNDYSLTIDGVALEGTRMDIKTNGLFSPYLRRGFGSFGWGRGYEDTKFVKPIKAQRITANTPTKIELNENDVNGDIYARIQNHMYASIEPGYDDRACANLDIGDSSFKVVTTMTYIVYGDDGSTVVVNAPLEGGASNVNWFAPNRVMLMLAAAGIFVPILFGTILMFGIIILK